MRTDLMFSKNSDEWETPQNLFDELNEEFHFTLDAAADEKNHKTEQYLEDALDCDWHGSVWLNPPYSLVKEFITKAEYESTKGATVVCLVPARTDTKWWHRSVWDSTYHKPRPNVEIRFLRGRLKFGGSTNSAPFPSVIIIFHANQPSSGQKL